MREHSPDRRASVRGLVIVSVVCLAAGVGLIFGYCNGTTGLQVASPMAGTALHIDITTKGWPALTGLALTGLGAFLMIVGFFASLSGLIWRREEKLKRREQPFEE
jgi:hypothetical protein